MVRSNPLVSLIISNRQLILSKNDMNRANIEIVSAHEYEHLFYGHFKFVNIFIAIQLSRIFHRHTRDIFMRLKTVHYIAGI